ncbi:MAG: DUF4392 domain-containing protein [Planctomycetota bacterium]|nr:MAG: DUF4392 domain-containing protein [Planctomycetota bacterium]
MKRLEELILRGAERRGVSYLVPHLCQDFLQRAAFFFLQRCRRVILTTGFYVLGAGVLETDGPPGAAAIARACQRLGGEVYLFVDDFSLSLWKGFEDFFPSLYSVPIAGRAETWVVLEKYFRQIRPTLLVAVERCGATEGGKYQNFRGADITPYTAKVDLLFEQFPATIGIGDGGNEIGMGNLASYIRRYLGIEPAAVEVAHLILATVSNWGAYALVRAAEFFSGEKLLWSVEEQREFLVRLQLAGFVDGISGQPKLSVDGYSLRENEEMLLEIHASG